MTLDTFSLSLFFSRDASSYIGVNSSLDHSSEKCQMRREVSNQSDWN